LTTDKSDISYLDRHTGCSKKNGYPVLFLG